MLLTTGISFLLVWTTTAAAAPSISIQLSMQMISFLRYQTQQSLLFLWSLSSLEPSSRLRLSESLCLLLLLELEWPRRSLSLLGDLWDDDDDDDDLLLLEWWRSLSLLGGDLWDDLCLEEEEEDDECLSLWEDFCGDLCCDDLCLELFLSSYLLPLKLIRQGTNVAISAAFSARITTFLSRFPIFCWPY